MMSMIRVIKNLYCFIAHEKKLKEAVIQDQYFTFKMGVFKGCHKCDIWKQIPEKTNFL
jgi:hypothetical protein